MHLLPTLKTGKAGGTSSKLRGYLQAIYIPQCPHLMHYVPLGLQLPGTGNPCSMLARTWSKIALLPLKGQRGGCWGVCGHCLLVSFVVNSKKGILSSKFFLIYMHSVCLHVCTRLLCSLFHDYLGVGSDTLSRPSSVTLDLNNIFVCTFSGS